MLLTISEGKKVRDFHGQTIYLQEFQYGNNVFQTTTNNSMKVHINMDEVRGIYSMNLQNPRKSLLVFGYGNIE